MNKSKKIKISIMAVLLIVTFFTGTFIRIKSCELHIRQVYWSTSDISEAVETKDYIITKNKNYYVNQKENDLKYKLIPEIDEGNKSVTNLVGSSESNIVYFLESKDNVNYIVEKSLDTYEEKIIYKSKNYDESVKLFGIDIIHNYDNVIKAIRILNNPKGLNIGARHISVSTSGLVPRIYDLANENIQCTLSVSLHASNDEKRSSMMPVNNAYNIEELMKACRDYIAITNKRISFEYALAKDNNDNLEDAKELVNLLKGMLCHVNLIPINKIENGKFTKSSNENIIKFRDYLNDHGIVATIRRELGSDIDAACGQLRRQNLKEDKAN